MGQLILCTAPLAAEPYYMESAAMHFYSLEEISFYLVQNAEFLDGDFMCREFCEWIRTQVKETGLAKQLFSCIERKASVCEFAGILLLYVGYAAREEIKKTLDTLAQLENKDESEIRKIRADRLLKKKKYAAAAFEYGNLLETAKEDVSAELLGNAYHNLGVSRAGMFLFFSAAECFRKAYEKNKNPESLKAELFCLLLSGQDGELEKRAQENSLLRELQKTCEKELDRVKREADETSEQIRQGLDGYENVNAENRRREIYNRVEIWKKEYKEYGR